MKMNGIAGFYQRYQRFETLTEDVCSHDRCNIVVVVAVGICTASIQDCLMSILSSEGQNPSLESHQVYLGPKRLRNPIF